MVPTLLSPVDRCNRHPCLFVPFRFCLPVAAIDLDSGLDARLHFPEDRYHESLVDRWFNVMPRLQESCPLQIQMRQSYWVVVM